jgi:hypothetical protein
MRTEGSGSSTYSWAKPASVEPSPANERWWVMTQDPMTREALETLLDQAARARRLAIAIEGDPAAPRLQRLAEELEAEIVQYARLE